LFPYFSPLSPRFGLSVILHTSGIEDKTMQRNREKILKKSCLGSSSEEVVDHFKIRFWNLLDQLKMLL
jgi:hypothetical protein